MGRKDYYFINTYAASIKNFLFFLYPKLIMEITEDDMVRFVNEYNLRTNVKLVKGLPKDFEIVFSNSRRI